jgi:hypothetical protein
VRVRREPSVLGDLGRRGLLGALVSTGALLLLGGLSTAASTGTEPPGGTSTPAPPTAQVAPATPAAPGAAGKVRFAPQPRAASSYRAEVHVQVFTKDVTFDAPPAYAEGFKFWTSRMKGSKRDELYQFLILTDDPAADGTVPFRRQISRFQIEMEKDGQALTAMSDAVLDMPKQVWEGKLDRTGNVQEIRRVAGTDDADMKEIATGYAVDVFPAGQAPREMSIGESVRTVSHLPLPSRLHVEGLEETGLVMTRELTLKQVTADMARFEIKTTFASDPATKSNRAGTSCTVSGSGTGEATFDLKRGVYQTTRQTSTLLIDLVAPLRRLPQMPETEQPGIGKSHIVLELMLTGTQDVHAILGSD